MPPADPFSGAFERPEQLPELLERLTPVGKPPKTAIVVEAEEVYTHCPKAFVRESLAKRLD